MTLDNGTGTGCATEFLPKSENPVKETVNRRDKNGIGLDKNK